MGPKYVPPAPTVPLEWKNEAPEEAAPPVQVCNWWEVFQDSALDDLERLAIEYNPNLYVALARIEEAEAERTMAVQYAQVKAAYANMFRRKSWSMNAPN